MEIVLVKTLDGALRPAMPEGIEQLAKLKVGAGVRCEVKQIRNYKFLQKTMVLFRIAYDHFCEYGISQIEYKGQRVVPCIDRFRKDLIVLSGHYTPVFGIRGDMRLQAKSLSYAKCSEEEAQQIYSDVINAALKNVYASSITAEELDQRVNELLSFA